MNDMETVATVASASEPTAPVPTATSRLVLGRVTGDPARDAVLIGFGPGQVMRVRVRLVDLCRDPWGGRQAKVCLECEGSQRIAVVRGELCGGGADGLATLDIPPSWYARLMERVPQQQAGQGDANA